MKPITTWEEFNKLLLRLGNDNFVRWYASVYDDGSKRLDILTFMPIDEDAPLWKQLEERGIEFKKKTLHTGLAFKPNGENDYGYAMWIYEFKTLPIVG